VSSAVRVIAFHLPQFHRIPENDTWWGDGYTEWTAVRNARPLFPGHYQPRQPRGGAYYDMLDVSALKWQQELAKQFGVYGFCYYNYWFLGRQLLEQPLELVLRHRELDLPFCISWANQTWSRNWYAQTREVLVEQTYGEQRDWDRHFDYLIRLFRDDRYIRVDGKPILIIHEPRHIGPAPAMFDRWRELASRSGLPGLHIVETLGSFLPDDRDGLFDARLFFEPGYTIAHDLPRTRGGRLRRLVSVARYYLRRLGYSDPHIDRVLDYREVCDLIVRRPHHTTRAYLGAFPDWDNSPRRQYRSTVFRGSTPARFHDLISAQLKRSVEAASEFLFVNAWNEWGEGAYLEPDERHGTAYLAALRDAVT
jgi:lipopolysaccharide biosynthesis protein